jgi:hypothetical protein
MAEMIPDIETIQEESTTSTSTPMGNGHETEIKIEKLPKKEEEEEGYSKGYVSLDDYEEKPARVEVLGWYFYGFCTYLIHSVLIPIVFPLIVSQTVSWPPQPAQGWDKSPRGLVCREKETNL